MHLSSRLSFSLLGGSAAVSLLFAMYQASLEMHTLRDEVQKQSLVLAESQRRAAERLLVASSADDLQTHVDQFHNEEELVASRCTCDGKGVSDHIQHDVRGGDARAVIKSLRTSHVQGEFLRRPDLSLHVLALPISTEKRLLGAIAIFHKVGFTGALLWRQVRASMVQTLLIVGLTLLLIRRSVGTHLHRITQWLGDAYAGEAPSHGELPKEAIFQPLAYEVTRLATSLNEARGCRRRGSVTRHRTNALDTRAPACLSAEKAEGEPAVRYLEPRALRAQLPRKLDGLEDSPERSGNST